jgi:tight adherence protein C
VQLDWMALSVTVGFLLAASAAGAMIYSIAASPRGAARRLRRRLAPSPDLPELAPERGERLARLMARGLTPLAKLAKPAGAGELSAIRARLVQAGFRSPSAVQLFLAAKVLLALAFLVVVLWVNAVRLEPLPLLPVWGVALAAAGLFLPNAWLHLRGRERQRTIDEGLPDALDLLVTCVEAGLGLDAALQRVAAEIGLARPVLAEELALTFLEVKAGAKRTDAFRALAERTGVQDLKTLAATLIQTELFGTSVAKALRIQGEGMRVRRMQRAEERAASLGVKMAFPLVLCFLPSLLAVILGPAWVGIATTFHAGTP